MERLLTAGQCPIDGPGSDLLPMKTNDRAEIIFLCPSCGVAWPRVPPAATVETLWSLADLAPEGATFATRQDLEAAGFRPEDIREVDSELESTWRRHVEALLATQHDPH